MCPRVRSCRENSCRSNHGRSRDLNAMSIAAGPHPFLQRHRATALEVRQGRRQAAMKGRVVCDF